MTEGSSSPTAPYEPLQETMRHTISTFSFAFLLAGTRACGRDTVTFPSDAGIDRFSTSEGGPIVTGPDSEGCQANDLALCLGKCGQLENGCGIIIDCGDCANGKTCGGGGTANTCGTGTCTPSCLNKACNASDDCGGVCTQACTTVCGASWTIVLRRKRVQLAAHVLGRHLREQRRR